jgi:hypothetical protein
LTSIKDENNRPYLNDRNREESIYKFYSDLYTKPTVQGNDMTIEEFLGNIAFEEDVINSKLTDAEKTSLDRPLTIEELGNSMRKSKLNSAPGIDGISNRFIQECWELFRVPLYKYAQKCFEKRRTDWQF